MFKQPVILVFALLIPAFCLQQPLLNTATLGHEYLRIGSYNVRYDALPDNITIQQSIEALPKGVPSQPEFYANTTEQPWSTRRFYIANDLLANRIDIYGGQELLQRQVDDVAALLGEQYSWVGVGRDNGLQAGEYAAIFYSRKTVTLLGQADYFWLSDTPFEPSKYPGAGSIRIATVARFKTRSGRSFSLINTHLDEQSEQQRMLGMSLILHRAKYEAIEYGHTVLLTGDFNSPPDDGAYQIVTGAVKSVSINQTFAERFSWRDDAERGFETFSMLDLAGQVPPQKRLGSDYATFTDFNPAGNGSAFTRLDYVMAGSGQQWNVSEYLVVNNLADDGVYHSDHRLVLATVEI